MRFVYTIILFALPQIIWGQLSTITLDSTVLQAREIVTNQMNPWDMVWQDNEIWFTTRQGYIEKVNPATLQLDTIHQISEVYNSIPENSGLHALGIHPNFASYPYIYTHYTYDSLAARLVRWTYDPVTESLIDSTRIIPHMLGARSHNGSRIAWDTDSTFLLTTGDAYWDPSAQMLDQPTGKILRFKWDGSIPTDNPYQNSPVWTSGHRNPQGLVVAPNGLIYSSEHGPQDNDEINIIYKGANYGWPNVSGACDSVWELNFCNDSNVVEPIYAFTPTYAVCGLEYYNHTLIPEFEGDLLLATLKTTVLLDMDLDASGTQITDTTWAIKLEFGRLRDVLVSPDGKVYICTSNHEFWNPPLLPGDDKIIELSPLVTTVMEQEPKLDRKIIGYFDLQGRQTNTPTTTGVYIILYNDGTREKRYVQLP